MRIRAFWDISPYSLVGVGLRFIGAYCLHNQGHDLMIEAVRTSETSVCYDITRRYIPKGSNLHLLAVFFF
jgi:hypothetical protein